MKLGLSFLHVTLLMWLFCDVSFAQSNSCEESSKDLVTSYENTVRTYEASQDSLEFYSNQYTAGLTKYIKSNSTSLDCEFNLLRDKKACGIVTSTDGLFRIYSWDTWLGGTMRDYNNLFQYKSDGVVNVVDLYASEGDYGTNFTDVFTLKTKDNVFYLAVSMGNYSSTDVYESISVFSVSKGVIVDTIPLIKVGGELQNSCLVEYDFFSVVNRPERPIKLIKYDANKKIISIPIVNINGEVTDRYVRYQFIGNYFEEMGQ